MAGIAGWAVPVKGALDEASLIPMLEPLGGRNAGEALVGFSERRRDQQVVLGAALCDRVSGIALVVDGTIANAQEIAAQLRKKGFSLTPRPTEVVLRAYQYWDKDLVRQLRGAFAFALWDPRKDRLMLARDRFGEKPLHYEARRGGLFFASEAKALLAAPGAHAQLDRAALKACLAHGFVAGPGTLLRGIRKLAPGAFALWQFGRLQETRYWIPPDRNAYVRRPRGDEVEGFIRTLEASAAERAGRAVLLSGGIDSAALVAVLATQGKVLKTYSLGFEGDRKSELPAAAAVAKHFGSEHHEIVVKPAELLAPLATLVARRDGPVAPSELAVHRLAAEARRGAPEVLSGDGCDEVVGGYRRLIAERVHPGFCRSMEEKRAQRAARLLREDAPAPEDRGRPPFDCDPAASPLRRALYEAQVRLPERLLERNDRCGAEIRMPFLDHRLAEFVSGLPDELRVRRLATKWILRESARRFVPPGLACRKAGFRLPVRDWLRHELRDTLAEHLQSGASQTRRYYDADVLDRLVTEHVSGSRNHDALLWTLLGLEIWHRRYRPA